jgi:predicted transcriptional regulator
MMEPVQCKMARVALGWSAGDLAEKAGVGIATVQRFEAGQTKPIRATIAAMQSAMEQSGIIFLAPGETTNGGYGVRVWGC